MDWHWDEDSGRRVATKPGSHVRRIVARVVDRILLPGAGLATWGWGVWELVTGSYWGGGALILAGGLLLVIWAGGGLMRWREALADWLGGP